MQKIYIWYLIHFIKRWYGYGAIDTKLIYAQAVHETGNFTSDIFKENKNLFGMRKPTRRKNFVSGENRGHAVFKSLFNSVRDYFLRQKEFNIPKVDNDAFIKKTVASGYAEDPEYFFRWTGQYNVLKVPVPKYLGKILTYALWAILIYFVYSAIKKQSSESRSFSTSVKKFKKFQPNLN